MVGDKMGALEVFGTIEPPFRREYRPLSFSGDEGSGNECAGIETPMFEGTIFSIGKEMVFGEKLNSEDGANVSFQDMYLFTILGIPYS